MIDDVCLTFFLIPAFFADTTFGPVAVVFYTMLAMIAILWNFARQEKTKEIITSSYILSEIVVHC